MGPQTLALLQAIVNHTVPPMYGYDLMRLSGLKSGTLYPLLALFEEQGYLSSRFEEIDVKKEGRAARRIYVLTAEGRRYAEQVLSQAAQKTRARVTGGLNHA